jgi:hypothetical protein
MVAAQGARTSQNEIAHARETIESSRIGSHGHSETHHLRQSAGDHGGTSVVPHTEPIDDAGRECHHIF